MREGEGSGMYRNHGIHILCPGHSGSNLAWPLGSASYYYITHNNYIPVGNVETQVTYNFNKGKPNILLWYALHVDTCKHGIYGIYNPVVFA